MTAFAMKRLTLGDPMAGLFIVHQGPKKES
jgi:hypothetical protein